MTLVDPVSAVAPDLRAAIGALPDLSGLDRGRLEEIRSLIQGESPTLGVDGKIVVSRLELHRPDSSILTALLYQPQKPNGLHPALLIIHGGGYVAGAAQREDAQARELAQQGCIVLVPDYRLAPEHPFPAALLDCQQCLDWLHCRAHDLNMSQDRVAVRGFSAGGGLALGLALTVRNHDAPKICHLQLVYPMLDDRTGPHPVNGKYVWPADANKYGWDSYLAGHDRRNPDHAAVPGRAENLSGLPPVFLATGSIDLFADENLQLARKLIDAGNKLELHVYPGAYHGFPLVVNSHAAQTFQRDVHDALMRAYSTAFQEHDK